MKKFIFSVYIFHSKKLEIDRMVHILVKYSCLQVLFMLSADAKPDSGTYLVIEIYSVGHGLNYSIPVLYHLWPDTQFHS
jgi:hypothetical protein